MTGARAQFSRRAAAPQPPARRAPVHRAPVAVVAAAAAAGRGGARQSVAASDRSLRGPLAVPLFAAAVVALTWVDAGVLRAEDTRRADPETAAPGAVVDPDPAGDALVASRARNGSGVREADAGDGKRREAGRSRAVEAPAASRTDQTHAGREPDDQASRQARRHRDATERGIQ